VSGSGTIFDSLAIAVSRKVWFCFSYVGKGVESSWDVRSRAGFVAWSGSPINAWDTAAQSKVLAAATNTLTVQHATAFPADVRAVNVFMAMSNASDAAPDRRQFAYVGTLHTNSEVMAVNVSIGPRAAHLNSITDANFSVAGTYDAAGNLPPGQYYVSLAWVVEGGAYDETVDFSALNSKVSASKPVSLTSISNAITVTHFEAAGASADGATHCYVLLGAKAKEEAPMTCVGIIRVGNGSAGPALTIKNVPYNVNFSSDEGFLYVSPHQKAIALQNRNGFIVKKDPDLSVSVVEVPASRSYWSSAPWSPDPISSPRRDLYKLEPHGPSGRWIKPPHEPSRRRPFNGLLQRPFLFCKRQELPHDRRNFDLQGGG
jgi:hypothetical protein